MMDMMNTLTRDFQVSSFKNEMSFIRKQDFGSEVTFNRSKTYIRWFPE